MLAVIQFGIVEGPKECLLLVGFSCDFWDTRVPKVAQIIAYGNACMYTQCYYTTSPIWTTDGSKRVISFRVTICFLEI